ncbi:MAG: 50S ribosomal protein L18e [Nanoarchaeota archaeon]
MKSIQRKIEVRLRRKTNPEIVETILGGKKSKNSNWEEVAKLVSRPRRKEIKFNLGEINRQSKENETVIIPGKVLGDGELTKKIKVVALRFSQSAVDKMHKHKIEFHELKDEIKKNPDAKNIHILKFVEE